MASTRATNVSSSSLVPLYCAVAVLYVSVTLNFYLVYRLGKDVPSKCSMKNLAASMLEYLDQHYHNASLAYESAESASILWSESNRVKKRSLADRHDVRRKPTRDIGNTLAPQSVDMHSIFHTIIIQTIDSYISNKTTEWKGDKGETGRPGFKGDRGEKGDRGYPGEPGPKGQNGLHGPVGPPGMPGRKGERGLHGLSGLDGRDGLPGQPGLDGVPGHNGLDGTPGKKGDPGKDGIDGKDGIPGLDGIPGIPGPPGQKGERGLMGVSGSRGPRGYSGSPGERGTNAICIYTIKGQPLSSSELLIPPSIVDVDQHQEIRAKEGETVQLRCTATGQPEPIVSWRRQDPRPIETPTERVSSVNHPVLNITRISRTDMGKYICSASNGIDDVKTKTIEVSVEFSPYIMIPRWSIGASLGGSVVLECIVESFPGAVNTWILGTGGRLLENGDKYIIDQFDDIALNSYTSRTWLTIVDVKEEDYGNYRCVSKNINGKAVGVLSVFRKDPSAEEEEDLIDVKTSGTAPPVKDKIGECRPCPGCPAVTRCVGPSAIITNVVAVDSTLNRTSWETRRTRDQECLHKRRIIQRMGKPVLYHDSKTPRVNWMRDSHPDSYNASKFYVTFPDDRKHLYEYNSKEMLRNDSYSKKHKLPFPFYGSSQLMYNGSLYYHENGTTNIVRFRLSKYATDPIRQAARLSVEDMAHLNKTYLYRTMHNYVDLSADENGLWAIYSSTRSNNTMILKFHEHSFRPEHVWNLTLDHRNVGEMFIVCGVLYIVNGVTSHTTELAFAYDLYADKDLGLSPVNFSNPFANTTLVTYNPGDSAIYTSNNGNYLWYPLLFNSVANDIDKNKIS